MHIMYVVCPLYVYHVALQWRYINTVIVVAEHVSIDCNPSETVWQNETNHMHGLKLHASRKWMQWDNAPMTLFILAFHSPVTLRFISVKKLQTC